MKVYKCRLGRLRSFPYVHVSQNRISVFLFDRTEDESKVPSAWEDALARFADADPDQQPMALPELVVNGSDLGAGDGKYVCRSYSTFSPEDRLGKGESTGHDAWVLACDSGSGLMLPPVNTMVSESACKPSSVRRWQSVLGAIPVCYLTLPFPGKALADGTNTLFIHAHPDVGFATNIAPKEILDVSAFGGASPFPTVVISGPESVPAGETAEYAVTLLGGGGETLAESATLYVETTAGYCPVRMLALSEGTARFRVTALGLSAGESVKVKVGWKYFTGAAEKVVAVTE